MSLTVRSPDDPQRAIALPRSSVLRVRVPKHRSTGSKLLGGFAGWWVGGLGGGLIGGVLGSQLVRGEQSGLAGAQIGILAGGVTGIIVGVRGGFRRPHEVIYTRPEDPVSHSQSP